ncbi:uncharacterized protein LOC122311006 [Carya illinoinensis]|uniref:Uncharacterized protein n=1 Tax=Carya illinoinensis TaxID=32201 RepID=A0A8T1QM02_CARIL|nr:uncharacterized protein LOC122311006 [Carya illinoinensis]KAG6655323.1 hypothetical protein CIPAW_05G208200 [Carya illinoinensis]KAG6714433.1 hypothetical protein I3842_05G202800 [Carya illinoinensis]
MGGCATKPKESDILAEDIHTDGCTAPKKDDGETSAQGTDNGVESQSEAPLMDISKEENGNLSSEPKTVEATPVLVEAAEEATKTTTEDKVEAPANESNDKVEAVKETQEPAKEEQAEAKTDKSDATPSSGDRSHAPVATA